MENLCFGPPKASMIVSRREREREQEKRGPCMAMAKRNWNGNRVIESENMSRNWRLLKYAHKKQSGERVRFGNTALWTTHSSPFKKTHEIIPALSLIYVGTKHFNEIFSRFSPPSCRALLETWLLFSAGPGGGIHSISWDACTEAKRDNENIRGIFSTENERLHF